MLRHISTLYTGFVDLGDLGQDATPVNERRFTNDQLATVYQKTETIAKTADRLGYYALWLAEHHFQHEGYECCPNILMQSLYLAQRTRRLKFGCGFNVAPMWHPIRLAEDYATADILTKGRILFGVGRGYHTREVETFGGPVIDQNRNREIFEEQVEVIMKAFHQESFSHHGEHYELPPNVDYRGYKLAELTVVPRPVYSRDCWQPIVSATPRGLNFMAKHNIKGVIGGGAAAMAETSITAYRDAFGRVGRKLALGENLCLGFYYYLDDSRERALQEAKPLYEEHIKMFAPLGFVPGLSPEQLSAVGGRGGWDKAGIPTMDQYTSTGAWYVGSPEGMVKYLKSLEAKYPGLEYINVSPIMGSPETVFVEQLERFARDVMPHFPNVMAAQDTRTPAMPVAASIGD